MTSTLVTEDFQRLADPYRRELLAHCYRMMGSVPDALVGAQSSDPAAIVTSRESIRLALVAALQHLPARQRVVLILREVLAWRASEVAELLGITTAAVNSILQRA